jgi:hypothetical protein
MTDGYSLSVPVTDAGGQRSMDANYDRIDAVLDRGHTADGSMLFIQVLAEDGDTKTLGLTPQRAGRNSGGIALRLAAGRTGAG